MGVVFCRDSWGNEWGGSRCVVYLSYVLSNGAMVSRKSDCVICVGWGIYSTICKLKLEFPWKSNVVWDLCRSKDFEKRDQWAQKNEIGAIWPLKNLKPLYDEEDNFFAGFWTKFRWLLVQANVKFKECIFVQYIYVFHFVCLCPRFLSHPNIFVISLHFFHT